MLPAFETHARAGRPRLLSAWSITLVCLVILFVRKTDAFTRPQFWAEDGPVYFMTARQQGLRSLLRPYDGVFYLVQRAIAWIGNAVPVQDVPAFYNYAALAMNLAVLAFIARSRIPITHPGLLALAVVCTPHSAEVWVNLTNLHWILGLGMLVLALQDDPKTTGGAVLESLLLAVMCLTGPFVLLFFPLFGVRAALRKSTVSWSFLAIVIMGALVQLACQLSAFRQERVGGTFDWHNPAWRSFWGNSLSGLLFVGPWMAQAAEFSIPLVLFSGLLYAWLTGYAIAKRDRACATFLFGAFSILAAVAYTYHGHPEFVAYPLNYRYFYIPFVCTAWALIAVAEKSRPFRLLAGALLLMIVGSAASHFRAEPLADKHWAEKSRLLGGPEPCVIPINPEPWRIYYLPPEMRGDSGSAAPAAGRVDAPSDSN